jgi:hypothetical protein
MYFPEEIARRDERAFLNKLIKIAAGRNIL